MCDKVYDEVYDQAWKKVFEKVYDKVYDNVYDKGSRGPGVGSRPSNRHGPGARNPRAREVRKERG